MSEKCFASVWDAIEDTPAAAENLKLRSALMIALKEQIERRGWTQGEAARRLGVTQPRVSDLMRGKVELFGLDTLANTAAPAGLHVENAHRRGGVSAWAAPENVFTLEPDDDGFFAVPLPRPRFTVEPYAPRRPRPGRAARIPTVAWTRQTIP
jgi:predicted XRE-type DNA-binding protein